MRFSGRQIFAPANKFHRSLYDDLVIVGPPGNIKFAGRRFHRHIATAKTANYGNYSRRCGTGSRRFGGPHSALIIAHKNSSFIFYDYKSDVNSFWKQFIAFQFFSQYLPVKIKMIAKQNKVRITDRYCRTLQLSSRRFQSLIYKIILPRVNGYLTGVE